MPWYFLHTTLEAQYGFNFPWWAAILIGAAFLGVIGYRGVEVSAKALLILSSLEILIMVTLAIWGMARPGAGGLLRPGRCCPPTRWRATGSSSA